MFNFRKAGTVAELFSGFTEQLKQILDSQNETILQIETAQGLLQERKVVAIKEAQKAEKLIEKLNEVL